MKADGSLLGVIPIKISLLVAAAGLCLLLTMVEPEESAGLSLVPRFLFWWSHACVSLAAIFAASSVLRLWLPQQVPLMVAVWATGVAGAVFATPPLLFLEQLFPHEQSDAWLENFSLHGFGEALATEFLDAGPGVLVFWVAINLPLLYNKPHLYEEPPSEADDTPDPDTLRKHQQRIEQLYDSLPQVLGKDIVAISSDLHYLNVYTSLGKTLMLGSLKHYVDAFAERGVQVHRSHWVAKAHVERIHISSDRAYCLMSNGMKVPISRSSRKEVKAVFGQYLKADSPVNPVRTGRAAAPCPQATQAKQCRRSATSRNFKDHLVQG